VTNELCGFGLRQPDLSSLPADPRCQTGAIVEWHDRVYTSIWLEQDYHKNSGLRAEQDPILRGGRLHVQDLAEGWVEWIDIKQVDEAVLRQVAPVVPDAPVIDTLF